MAQLLIRFFLAKDASACKFPPSESFFHSKIVWVCPNFFTSSLVKIASFLASFLKLWFTVTTLIDFFFRYAHSEAKFNIAIESPPPDTAKPIV